MKDRMLFPTCPDGEFFGRAREIDYICRRAAEKPSPAIFLFGRRWTGKTETLRRVYMELFWNQARVVPLYYQFKGYGAAEEFSEDYIKEVLKQYLAFRLRDARYVRQEVSLDKLERLLVDNDLYPLADLVAIHREARAADDTTAALRNALSSPTAVSSRSGIPVYLILDDLDKAAGSSGGKDPQMTGELMGSLTLGASFVASASSRVLFGGSAFNGSAEAMELTGLDEEQSASMMLDLCRQYSVDTESEILKLAANRLEGNPMYMKSLVWAASKAGHGLSTLKEFADLYTSELFDGNIGLALRSALGLNGINSLRVLHACSVATRPISDEELSERFRQGAGELKDIIEGLSRAGLIEVNLGSIKWAGDSAIKDFIYFVYETRVKGRSSEEVRTYLAREVLKEGFNFRSSKISIKLKDEAAEIIKAFNNQKILKILLRNQPFAARFKKGSVTGAGEEGEVHLPQTVGCFDSGRLEAGEAGPPILVAHGFQNGRYDSGNEVVWMVSIKDSASPVNIGDVENFLRRSQILKENFRAARLVRWMIGREGFTVEAGKRADSEGVFSSDAVQLRIIKENIADGGGSASRKSPDRIVPVREFEVVLPSASKAELVAAKAVEEIGTEMGFDDAAIGQIKAALVEACINAFEHSRLKSAKVFLRFVTSVDRLTIYVQNGGVDFDSPAEPAPEPAADALPRKRGWGFELMKGLMDEVRVERIRGGAKIVLVKYLVKKGDGRNGQEV